MRRFAIVVLVVGCASSSKSKTTPDPVEDPAVKAAREKREKREKEIDALKPADPYERRDQQAYQPADRCGQGPYHLETEGLKAKYGERLVVYACGKHSINGNYRLTTARKYGTPDKSESQFGWGTDNKACKGKEVAVVTSTETAKTGGGGGGGTGKTGGPTSAAPAKLESRTLTKTTVNLEDCTKTQILQYGWTSGSEFPALDGKQTIDVWSDEPNDLEGLTFVIERHAVVADMTPERWKAYNAAYDVWYDAYRAFSDEQVASGRWKTVDTSVKTPPPPAPRAESLPPKPSVHARWIPGYWLYSETKFHWITGLWDVPEEDIKKEQTVEAPTPPPATPTTDVPVEPAPTQTAVWTPGAWYWDGRAYVWVGGAWRIPPNPQSTWQRSSWTVRTGRSVFVPGGWRIRIGR